MGSEHTTFLPRGGTSGHMHQILDGLAPAAAVAAVEREFAGWHVHLSDTGAVWADTDMGPRGGGAPVTLRAANAEQIWREMAATEHHWFWAAAALVAGVTP